MVVLKRISLMGKVAAMTHPSTTDQVNVLVQLYGDIIKAGTMLTSSVSKLEALGSDANTRIAKDSNSNMLTGTLKTQSALQEKLGKLTELITNHRPSHDLLDLPGSPCDDDASAQAAKAQVEKEKITLIELYNVNIGEMFVDVLASDMVADCLSYRCHLHHESAVGLVSELCVITENVIGENNWKQSLSEEDAQDKDKVIEKAMETIFKLGVSGKQFKAALSKAHEVGGVGSTWTTWTQYDFQKTSKLLQCTWELRFSVSIQI